MRQCNDNDDEPNAKDNQPQIEHYDGPETKSPIGAVSLAYLKDDLDNTTHSKAVGINIYENTTNKKIVQGVTQDVEYTSEVYRSDLSSSKEMLLQKLLDGCKAKYTRSNVAQDNEPPENNDTFVEPANQNKIVYNKMQLTDLKVLGMSLDDIQRLVSRNENVLLVLKSCYDKSEYLPLISTELKFLLDKNERDSPLESNVATREEMEIFASLSKSSVKSVSSARQSMSPENTADSLNDIKARLLQRSKELKAKMRNLTKD